MLIHPNIDPVAIQIGPLAVRWYGLMYLAGFMAGWWLGVRRIKAGLAPVTREQLDDLLFYAVLGVILGGRLGYVLFYKPGYYFAHPLQILEVWHGGMSFHGGFLGVLVAMGYAARKHRINWWALMDYVAPLCPIGLAAGRLGNFINGELWGRVTTLPWGMVFPGARAAAAPSLGALRVRARGRGPVRDPVVVFVQAAAARPGLGAVPDRLRQLSLPRRVHAPAGRLPRLSCTGLTMGQWLSLPMIVAGIVLFAWTKMRRA